MSSTLGNNIIDSLVGVIDDIRGSIHPVVGDRQYRVYAVTRTWPSGRRGDLSAGPAQIGALEITPSPRVFFRGDDKGVHFDQHPTGKSEQGVCVLSEISLAFSEDQLSPQNLGASDDFYYRLVDKKGQLIPNRYYKPAGPPATDLEKDIGWVLTLRRAQVTEAYLQSVVVTPDPVAVASGLSQQMLATGTWSDGAVGDATQFVHWRNNTNSPFITFSADGVSGGRVFGVSPGAAPISAVVTLPNGSTNQSAPVVVTVS